MKRIKTMLVTLALANLSAFSHSYAQTYPTKPIRLIVSVAAGGPIDTIARALAEGMQPALGQPVVVENKPGAGGTLGAKSVEAAAPDGYTLLLATLQTHGIADVLYEHQNYRSDRFIPIGLVAEFPFVFVVPTPVPAASVKEFVEFAKKTKEPLSFGGSLATPAHLLPLLFNRRNGLDITYVPYRGLAPSISDLITARTHMAFDALPTLLPLINEGKLRPLAVLSQSRLPALPNVPTMIESGYTDFPTNPWTGVVAPPGTPNAIIVRVNAAINTALAAPETKARMQSLFLVTLGGSPEEFSKRIKSDTPVWQEIVRLSGAKAQ
jgi:tripartite-type tricarboxylate transporter receptor subunit TctC